MSASKWEDENGPGRPKGSVEAGLAAIVAETRKAIAADIKGMPKGKVRNVTAIVEAARKDREKVRPGVKLHSIMAKLNKAEREGANAFRLSFVGDISTNDKANKIFAKHPRK
jgi:hypothetical protein